MRVNFKKVIADDYAFPGVNIEGDHATIDRIITWYYTSEYASEDQRRTQELVNEDGVWKIIPRPEQVKFFTTG
jgi:hypothetical protein